MLHRHPTIMEKKSPNFTSIEVEFLVSTVKKWRKIIECKISDHTSSEEKLKAWKEIEREFNSKYSHTFRSHKVLKTKYANIKSTSKQNFAADKRATYATGGGPAIAKSATKLDHSILEICQESQVLGNSSNFDGDADDNGDFDIVVLEDGCGLSFEMLDDNCDNVVNPKNNVERKEEVKDAKADEVVFNENLEWKKYTPRMLKRPLDKSLESKKDTTNDSWAKVAEAKLIKHNLEIEVIRENQEFEKERQKFEKERQELENQKLKLEIELLQTQIINAKKNII